MAEPAISVDMMAGAALAPLLPELARLRTTVFRDWPYLYDGTEADEATYLHSFSHAPDAGLAVARCGSAVVGASTCMKLTDAAEDVRAPFNAAGLDPSDFFYFGESVLLAAYRGQGIGVRFFELREAHALSLGRARFTAFCAVDRPADHPRRPPGAHGLDAFWTHRGYRKRPGFACRMRWKDVDAPEDSEKSLTFWMKPLHGDPLP